MGRERTDGQTKGKTLPDDSQINTNEQTTRQITGLTVNNPVTEVQS